MKSPGLTALLVPLAGSGCYTADLDPDLPGVFACDRDGDPACPSGQTCVNERCEDEDSLPTLSVLSPEDEQVLLRTVFDPLDGMPAGPAIDLKISVQGSLELSSGGEHVFGEGRVVVYVDGEEQETLDSGSISGATEVEVKVPPLLGPHRIELQAVRNDGEEYDHPGAQATRLFWFKSNLPGSSSRPMVAIKSPWPGDAFDVDDTEIDVEVAVLDFDLRDPGTGQVAGQGHVHIHYDDEMPQCTFDPGCSMSGYLGIAGRSGVATITLPESGEIGSTLSAVLRHNDHSPYGLPFGCVIDGPPSIDNPCAPIIDEIDILRVDD